MAPQDPLMVAVHTPPYAFTEQGLAMLSSVLRSSQAIEVNGEIIRTFVRLRWIIESHFELAEQLSALEQRHEQKFQSVFEAINQLTKENILSKKRRIGFGNDREA